MARPPLDPASPPPATRAAASGWRDPRLWIGVLLVVASVAVGARIFASLDDTEPVWTVRADMGAGDQVTGDDLVARRVHFSDASDLDLYYPADDPLPGGATLLRGVGAGELLPRAAVGDAADAGTLEVPVEVEPNRVPPSVQAGSVVDVYLAGGRKGDDGPALEAVTVVDAPSSEEGLAVSGLRQLVLAVPEADVDRFEAALGRLDDPGVRILQRS